MQSRRAKWIAVIAVLMLLAIFLPPNINGTRFRDRLAPALSTALGRQVRIGTVKYRLFPRPGFDVYDFQVMEDPAFGAEPMLMCGKVTADLRLTSLWQGRLEIANLKLTDDRAPASLNLVYANGHWNVESLLFRAEQVPTAPTAKRRAEQRARFPYIEVVGGRINFKKGAEKKSYTLSNTDFGFWLAAEDVWHVRLEGHPVRTDMNLNDTGTVRLEGDLRRSSDLRQMPVKLDLSWEKTQLGQFSKLLSGQDHGWRGDLEGNALISGTLANLHLALTADLSHFHRYDVNRDSMGRFRTRCLGDFSHGLLELKCDMPLDPGGLLLTARWSAAAPFDYDLSMVADHVPLATISALARHSRAILADDLTASGDFNAAFGFHSHNGERNWHGTGMTSPFLLRSSIADKPIPVSPIKFHIGALESAPPARKGKHSGSEPPRQPDSFTVDAFSVQLGPSTALQIQGAFNGSGYRIEGRGLVPLERLLVLGRLTGLAGEFPSLSASAVVDLSLAGDWTDSAPHRVRGTANIQNLTAWIPGVRNRLVLTEAEAQLTDSGLVLNRFNAEFEHSPLAFTGKLESPWKCGDMSTCPVQFDLHAEKLAVHDLNDLLGLNDRGWNLPFFSSSGKLPHFRAQGSLSVDELLLEHVQLEKFAARLDAGDQSLEVTSASARLGGGAVAGEWRADWSQAEPHFTSSGTLAAVALDHLGTSTDTPGSDLLASWLSGKADGKYSVQFQGKTSQEMWTNATGKIDLTLSSGTSRALTLQSAKALKFQTLEINAELGKQTLIILPSKMRAENRIYEMSGKVSLADQQAHLKVTNGGSRWEITGALDKPQITPEPMTAETTSVRRQ